jgi:predicted tellurium resistance membrane protein TerC
MTFPDFSEPSVWLSLLTLTFLEIVLGVDNIIFISIVAGKLPPHQQARARNMGLLLALLFRLGLLFTITWMIKLVEPVFEIPFIKEKGQPIGISWKDLILLIGGIFLIAKSTLEIHNKLEKAATAPKNRVFSSFSLVIAQIILVDMIFSFDSILTAVGLVDNIWIMVIAILASMGVMLAFAGVITRFINRNPTLQMLALAFLIVIGIMLVAQGFHQEVSKSYIYSSLAFALLVEVLNIRLRKNKESVQLNTNGQDLEEIK